MRLTIKFVCGSWTINLSGIRFLAVVMEVQIHTEQRVVTTVSVEWSHGRGFWLTELRVGGMSNGGRSIE